MPSIVINGTAEGLVSTNGTGTVEHDCSFSSKIPSLSLSISAKSGTPSMSLSVQSVLVILILLTLFEKLHSEMLVTGNALEKSKVVLTCPVSLRTR